MSFRNVFMSMSLIALPDDVDDVLSLVVELLIGGKMAIAASFRSVIGGAKG